MSSDKPNDELDLEEIIDLIIEGQIDDTREMADKALKAGVDAHKLITGYLVPAMEEVGAMFESGEYFVSEMLVSARAAGEILKLAEPYLVKGGYKPVGVVVMGTVRGDMHDIGKNIVCMMLKGNGFQVVDLGTDVGPAKFVKAIHEHNPDIIGMSALLTTTMNSMAVTIETLKEEGLMADTIETLKEEGLRDKVGVMVGGAPITQAFADAIGADGFASDAASAVRLASKLLEAKKAKVLT